jgi:hypothetical protein
MKKLTAAAFVLTLIAAAAPQAWAGTVFPLIVNSSSILGQSVHLEGWAQPVGGSDLLVVNPVGPESDSFSLSGLLGPLAGLDTTGATYSVEPVDFNAPGFMPKTDDDTVNLGTGHPFDLHGLLIQLTSGNDDGDYVLITRGIGATASIVSIFNDKGRLLYLEDFPKTAAEIAIDPAVTPEPSSLLLLLTGMLALAMLGLWNARPVGAAITPAPILLRR